MPEAVEAPQVPNNAMETGGPTCHPQLYPPLLPMPEEDEPMPLAEHMPVEPTAPPPPNYQTQPCIPAGRMQDPNSNTMQFHCWSGIIRDAILEGDWVPASNLACPITISNGEVKYEQPDWKVLQQAKKAIRECGVNLEDSHATLDWIFSADINLPLDCKNLARLFLTLSRFISWNREWT